MFDEKGVLQWLLMNAKITTLPKSMVEIEGELSENEFGAYRERAVRNVANAIEIDGFRKGMAPEAVLVQKVGDMAILEEMAHLALQDLYPKLVAEHELDVIGPPDIAITKIGKGSVLGFKIKSAVVPGLELPNYKKIAEAVQKEKADTTATDKDVEETLEEIRKQRAMKKEGSEPELPALDDAFAKSLGKFESLEELRAKLKENIGLDKELRVKEKKRIDTIEKITADTKGEIPDILAQSEAEKMAMRLRADLERAGLVYEDYLKNVGKTEEALRKEWAPEAEKRAKIELVLMKIAEVEGIKPSDEEIEKEVKHVLEHYADAKEDRVRDYVANLIQNEKVFQFLEGQK